MEVLNMIEIQPQGRQQPRVRGNSKELGVNGTRVVQALYKPEHISRLKEIHASFIIRHIHVHQVIDKNHTLEVFKQFLQEYLGVTNGQMSQMIMM
jgi:hypothetical protein